MCECAEAYGQSPTHTHTTTQAVSSAMATSRCENTERAIMCNMLSNSIAPSLSLPFVTPNLFLTPCAHQCGICLCPPSHSAARSVRRAHSVAICQSRFHEKGADFQESQQPETQLFPFANFDRCPCSAAEKKASLMTHINNFNVKALCLQPNVGKLSIH